MVAQTFLGANILRNKSIWLRATFIHIDVHENVRLLAKSSV